MRAPCRCRDSSGPLSCVTPGTYDSRMNDELIALEELRSDCSWQANERAARATRAWLMGRGLAAEAHDLLIAPVDGNVPAPGLFSAIRMMGEACTESCNASDGVWMLLRHEFDETSEEKLEAGLETGLDAAREVERWMRRIAALCIGLSAQLPNSDATARSDRAAVVALKAFSDPADLADDGVWHSSTNFDELATELAGDLGRMVIDHDCKLLVRDGDAADPFSIEFEVDEIGNLTVRATGAGGCESNALVDLGWTEDDGVYQAEWDDPLPLIDPTWMAITTLVDLFHVSSPEGLDFSIESTRPTASFVED